MLKIRFMYYTLTILLHIADKLKSEVPYGYMIFKEQLLNRIRLENNMKSIKEGKDA